MIFFRCILGNYYGSRLRLFKERGLLDFTIHETCRGYSIAYMDSNRNGYSVNVIQRGGLHYRTGCLVLADYRDNDGHSQHRQIILRRGKNSRCESVALVLNVAVPFAVPNILQGLTQGMSTACLTLITAEMVGVESGLGWYVSWQRSWAQYGKMYAAIVVLCIVFIAVNWGLNAVKRRLLRWQEGMTE